MSDTLQSIINAAADEADSLLDGVDSPAEAKPVLLEWLADAHPSLTADQRHTTVRGILSILNREGFFETASHSEGGGAPDSDDDEE